MPEHYGVFLSYARADAAQVHRLAENLVGRRREKRRILQALARPDRAGVVLHGLDGVGKSSLSAEVLRNLLEERWLVASVHGEISPDDLLAKVGRCYLAVFQQEGMNEADPRRQLTGTLGGRPDIDWEERFDLLSRNLLEERPLIILLDNFEDNLVDGGLGPALKSADLADLLARWIRNPGRSRFLFTSRLPFELPERAHHQLEALHLGPLSFAETRKLLRRLPGLDALSREDQLRAYTDVGGHPRALEYLDVLLRDGESRFPDVAERLELALEKEGVRDPRAWLRRAKGDLDQALAATVTRAVDDVLLDRLLEKLEGVPLAKELLLGASVYRTPVDRFGLAWQVGEEIEIPEDREHPPLVVPEGFKAALEVLETLELLAPVQGSSTSEDPRFAVHRWTASSELRRAPDCAVRQAHHRAARHWRWRAERAQSRHEAIVQLFAARHHYREAGEVDQAGQVTEWICSQLDAWRAYRQEEQLCREALTWLPERSTRTAAFLHQLGNLAYRRGAYDQALDWSRRTLRVDKALGNKVGVATEYRQLGLVAQQRGAYDEARFWYKKSLQISEELSDREGMARSCHQLGTVAQKDEAQDWYMRALQLSEELSDREGMARLYDQLGRMAEGRCAYDQALDWYKRALKTDEELGNREGMAVSYHQLGLVTQKRCAYDQALDWYKRSLQINEELGNRTGMASSMSQMGVLATEQGRPEEGLPLNLRGLAIRLELGVPEVRIDLNWLGRQRELLGEERFNELLWDHAGEERAEAVLGLLAQVSAADAGANWKPLAS